MNYDAIKKAAEGYKADMVKFLRDMIAIPSESCEEEGVVKRIAAEMEKLGYDKVEFDKLGNVIGWMGTGDKIIAIDSHIDTVGIGNRENWTADPYEGYETDDIIYGRGGSDQEGGMASATYGAKIMKDLGLIPDGYKIMVVGSVQEEDCDGMCWQSIVNEYFGGPEDARNKIEFVISTEPTDGGIYRGHRGRMEIRVDMHGVSCHGSAPERGDNAIHKMAEVILNVRDLNENDAGDDKEIKGLVKMLDPKYNPEHYEDARFLGRGTCTTSQIFYTSPSRCAVADSCSISIDRRMTAGETYQSCLKEIEDLPACKKYAKDVKVSMYMYDRPAWTGHVYETECFFPTWINKASAPHVQALVDAHHALWGDTRLWADETARDKARGPPADRQVDLLHQRRFHPGPLRHPVRRLRPRRRVSGSRAQRDHLEAGPRRLRCAVRRCSHALQAREQGRLRHLLPSGTHRQRHQVSFAAWQACAPRGPMPPAAFKMFEKNKEKEHEQNC